MQYLKYKLESSNSVFKKEIQFIQPEQFCPSFPHDQDKHLPLTNVGYCALWILLVLKIVLKFPTYTLSKMMQEIFLFYPLPENVQNLLYDFVNEICTILIKEK